MVYWFIFRPQTRGVKCIIEHDGMILLVRLGYAHKGWTIPGGGVKKDETFEQAAVRESFEEVGIRVGHIQKVCVYKNVKEHKRDTVEVFFGKGDSEEYKVDGFEVVEAMWFDLQTSLPTPYTSRLPELVEKYKSFKLQ